VYENTHPLSRFVADQRGGPDKGPAGSNLFNVSVDLVAVAPYWPPALAPVGNWLYPPHRHHLAAGLFDYLLRRCRERARSPSRDHSAPSNQTPPNDR
jgi:hypothetical protein